MEVTELENRNKNEFERISIEHNKAVQDFRDAIKSQDLKIEIQNIKYDSVMNNFKNDLSSASQRNKDYADKKTSELKKDFEVKNAENKYEIKFEIFQTIKFEIANEIDRLSNRFDRDIKSSEINTKSYVDRETKSIRNLLAAKTEQTEEEQKRSISKTDHKILLLEEELKNLKTLLSKKVDNEDVLSFKSEVKDGSQKWNMLLTSLVVLVSVWLYQQYVHYRAQGDGARSTPIRNGVQQVTSLDRQIGSPEGDTRSLDSN